MKKINVYILTGFLGAGKTTILNQLLKSFGNQRNVVIENEFGKINIDARLIAQKFEAVFELTNGCICCSLDEELYETLSEIYRKKDVLDNLFIETTGIADVRSIAAIFKRADIAKGFELKMVLCIIDAVMIEKRLKEAQETALQVVGSDVIYFNKTETIVEQRLENLQKILGSINPLAKFAINKELTVDFLENFEKNAKQCLVFDNKFSIENPHKINNVLFETEDVFKYLELYHVLNATLLLYFHQVFRIKGFVKCTDGICYEVQSTGNELTFSPIVIKYLEKSQLVFIGMGLKTDTVTRILRPAIVKNPSKSTKVYEH